MDFYTYIYYDPSRNNEPFYVGKGTGNRAWIHTHHGYRPINMRLAQMRAAGVTPQIGVYAGLDEAQAGRLETQLIASIGRLCKGTGPLVNIAYGGGRPRAAHTPESRAKIAKAKRGSVYCKTRSRESRCPA